MRGPYFSFCVLFGQTTARQRIRVGFRRSRERSGARGRLSYMDQPTEYPRRAAVRRGSCALPPLLELVHQPVSMEHRGVLPGVLQGEDLAERIDRPGYVLDNDVEPAGRPPAARHGERGLPTRYEDSEWMRIAAAAAAAAAREEELDNERELFFGGEAADSEQERDAHCARLNELHRAACLRRTSGPAFKQQVGSGNARTTFCRAGRRCCRSISMPSSWLPRSRGRRQGARSGRQTTSRFFL